MSKEIGSQWTNFNADQVVPLSPQGVDGGLLFRSYQRRLISSAMFWMSLRGRLLKQGFSKSMTANAA
jgi:hypothetical protein